MNNPPPAGYVTLTAAAFASRMDRSSLLDHIHLGRLPASKRNGRWLIAESELEKWLGVNRPEVLKAQELMEEDNKEISLFRWPKIREPMHRVSLNTPDIDFLVGELRQKISYLEYENRRLEDQNLRFRNIIRDELALWSGVVNEGKALSYGKAKRHISTLLGATNYDGRSESPLEYRPPTMGGNLRKPYERQCRGETDESKKPAAEATIIDLQPKPRYRPDRQGIRDSREEGKEEITTDTPASKILSS